MHSFEIFYVFFSDFFKFFKKNQKIIFLYDTPTHLKMLSTFWMYVSYASILKELFIANMNL